MTVAHFARAGPHHDALNARELARDQRHERAMLFGLCSPALLFTLLIIFVPVGWLSWLSLFNGAGALSAENYLRLIERQSYIKTFETTFHVAFVVTIVCVILGYPLAYMLSQIPRRAAAICMIFVILPFWTSVLVRTYAWLVILQRNPIYSVLALIAAFLGHTGL